MVSCKKKKTGKEHPLMPLIIGIAIALGATILAAAVFVQKREEDTTALQSVYAQADSDTVTYQGKIYRYNDHLSNFLFLGVDKKEKVKKQNISGNGGQADALYLLSRDRVKNTISVLAIPRDTITQIQVYDLHGNDLGKTEDHISLSYAYGDGMHKSCTLTRDAVSELLYGVPIQGYCALNIDAVPILADSVGGVTVTVPDDSLSGEAAGFVPGSQVTLNGENAEFFVRYRDIEEDQSAIGRMERQKVFLKAYGQRLKEAYSREPSIVGDILSAIDPYMVTSIGNDQYLKLVDSYLTAGETASYTVPGKGAREDGFDEYHVDEDALYEIVLEIFYEEVNE